MRNTLMLTAALLGFAAAPAFAENMMSTTQSPPAANSSEAGVQSDNSLPQAADTSNYDLAGSSVGGEQATQPRVVQRSAPVLAEVPRRIR